MSHPLLSKTCQCKKRKTVFGYQFRKEVKAFWACSNCDEVSWWPRTQKKRP